MQRQQFKLKIPLRSHVEGSGLVGAIYDMQPTPVLGDDGQENFRFVFMNHEVDGLVTIRIAKNQIEKYFEPLPAYDDDNNSDSEV